MQRKYGFVIFCFTGVLLSFIISGCTNKANRSKAVYMLLDTSGTRAGELQKARTVVNFLLGVLQPGDMLAVGGIDTDSFSEKDIIAKVAFNDRPSVANMQKRAFKKKIDTFARDVNKSNSTDIYGGILQAVECLNETGAENKYILLFSDLQEELVKERARDVPFQLAGFKMIAVNVTPLSDENHDPDNYLNRVERWRLKIERGGGKWLVSGDIEQLESIFTE